MSEAGDIRTAIKRAQQQGLRVEDRGSKWIVYAADGADHTVIDKPHKGSGNIRTVIRALRRLGFHP